MNNETLLDVLSIFDDHLPIHVQIDKDEYPLYRKVSDMKFLAMNDIPEYTMKIKMWDNFYNIDSIESILDCMTRKEVVYFHCSISNEEEELMEELLRELKELGIVDQ